MAKNFLRRHVFLQPSTQFRGKVPELYNVYPSVRLPAELQGFPVEFLSDTWRARDQDKTNPKTRQNFQKSSCDKKQSIYCTSTTFKNDFFVFRVCFCTPAYFKPGMHFFPRGCSTLPDKKKRRHPPADDVSAMRHSVKYWTSYEEKRPKRLHSQHPNNDAVSVRCQETCRSDVVIQGRLQRERCHLPAEQAP